MIHHGNGNTDGICFSIFPLLSLFDLFLSPDEVGQSPEDEDPWRLQSVEPFASKPIPDAMAKFASKMRKKTETHIQVDSCNRISPINHTNRPSIFDLPIRNLS